MIIEEKEESRSTQEQLNESLVRDENIIELSKEEVVVGKKKKLQASYTFKKQTDTYQLKDFIELSSDQVQIEEVVQNREISEHPSVVSTEFKTIIPVVKEIEVVTKKLILVKEIHITKRTTTDIKEIPITVKEDKLIVTKEDHK